MIKVTRMTGGSDYRVTADSAVEMDPLRETLDSYGAEWLGATTCTVWSIYKSRVDAAVASLSAQRAPGLARPVAIRAQQPADIYRAPREAQALRGRGLCVECGDPTDAPHHLYCRECYSQR